MLATIFTNFQKYNLKSYEILIDSWSKYFRASEIMLAIYSNLSPNLLNYTIVPYILLQINQIWPLNCYEKGF